jgi:Rab-like protein 2
VGKSKLVERYLMDNYHPRQRSTYALTLYRHEEDVEEAEGGEGSAAAAATAAGGGSEASAGSSSSSSSSSSSEGAAPEAGAADAAGAEAGAAAGGRKRKRRVAVDFWDTAGQERFASMHASYYYRAHACVLVFDVTRKVTYTNLQAWYRELRQFCPHIPCICIANKIDVDYAVTTKAFAFPGKHGLPFFFVSAADGTNVVAIFQEAVRLAWAYKTRGEKDFVEEVLELIDDVSGGGCALPCHLSPALAHFARAGSSSPRTHDALQHTEPRALRSMLKPGAPCRRRWAPLARR